VPRDFLPRLPREYYQGDAVVLWTLPILNRATGWLTDKLQTTFRELTLHAAAREGLICPIYCLMPDHIHLIWMGLRRDSDQLNGMSFLRTYLEPELQSAKFQVQPHDHVLREKDRKRNAFSATCSYISQNPVRSSLAKESNQWPFTNSIIPGYPKLSPHDRDYWQTFWRIYAKLRHPDAGDIRRPPI
jgi:putative transposase